MRSTTTFLTLLTIIAFATAQAPEPTTVQKCVDEITTYNNDWQRLWKAIKGLDLEKVQPLLDLIVADYKKVNAICSQLTDKDVLEYIRVNYPELYECTENLLVLIKTTEKLDDAIKAKDYEKIFETMARWFDQYLTVERVCKEKKLSIA